MYGPTARNQRESGESGTHHGGIEHMARVDEGDRHQHDGDPGAFGEQFDGRQLGGTGHDDQ